MKRIPLRARDGRVRAYAIVDDDDFERIGHLRWSLHRQGYARRRIGEHQTSLHRFLLGLDFGDPREVDHLNGDRLDNRRANLRIVTRSENAQNLGRHPGASRYRGVSRMRDGWRATVKIDRRTHFVGFFYDELDAARAAAEFRRRHMPHANPARDGLTGVDERETKEVAV